MHLLQLLGLSPPPEEEPIEAIKLEGPFLPQELIIRNKARHIELLRNTMSKCNLTVGRDLMVFSTDYQLQSRDDSRIEIGLNHHIHQLELSFLSNQEYEILAIDNFVILNPSDAHILKEYMGHHLPTEEELKRCKLKLR
jgi:hypothetical protein